MQRPPNNASAGPVVLTEPVMFPEAEPEAIYRPDWAVNRLIEGDCLEHFHKIPSKSVHLILCDLPYGTTQNKWDSVIPLEPLWKQYRRVLAPNGVLVLSSQGPFTAHLILSNEKWFKYKFSWIKSKPTNFLNSRHQPLRRHEDLCVFYERKPTYQPQMQPGEAYDKGVRKNQLTGSYGDFEPVRVQSTGARFPTDVVYFKTAESEGKVWHPTQKPLALGRYLVRTFSKPGQVVLDNAFGSGSFLVSALLEGRNFIGIERNAAETQFKKSIVDLMALAHQRIERAWASLPAPQRDWVMPVGELAPSGQTTG